MFFSPLEFFSTFSILTFFYLYTLYFCYIGNESLLKYEVFKVDKQRNNLETANYISAVVVKIRNRRPWPVIENSDIFVKFLACRSFKQLFRFCRNAFYCIIKMWIFDDVDIHSKNTYLFLYGSYRKISCLKGTNQKNTGIN